ncbi:putative nucleoside-diphosphate-sugar epimerase [Mycena venus]|uniref:Putative nucleoside-diphosphate-sugar epimerase n=1 Tax=Mycena venus TaxID=2733690 RepID=A0A8H6X8Z7_9AGAR|nr:putative nucleoside-diphosphate-sugar epimerase [Mycena venus]
MKLIVTGATGFVAQEVIRQSLRNPNIKSIVALARKPVVPPPGADASKLKSIVVKDYDEYTDEVKKEFSGADACIWTVAITPTKSKEIPFDEVKRVCQTSTLVGLSALHEAGLSRPFRFLYMSGIAAERDQSKTPQMMPEYSLMRGETENRVLAFAAEHSAEKFEACVAKPGLITHDAASVARAEELKLKMGLPSVTIEEVSAAMLHQVLHGFQKEPLLNGDLVEIGQQALGADDSKA